MGTSRNRRGTELLPGSWGLGGVSPGRQEQGTEKGCNRSPLGASRAVSSCRGQASAQDRRNRTRSKGWPGAPQGTPEGARQRAHGCRKRVPGGQGQGPPRLAPALFPSPLLTPATPLGPPPGSPRTHLSSCRPHLLSSHSDFPVALSKRQPPPAHRPRVLPKWRDCAPPSMTGLPAPAPWVRRRGPAVRGWGSSPHP